MWTIILTVLVFGVIITIHELGHFISAKLCGVKVNDFSIGMGPKLFSIQKGETAYSLRLLPIGGSVSMEGEDLESEDQNAFCQKSTGKRFLIVSAGAIMNLILGMIVLICAFAPKNVLPTNTISSFREGAVSCDSGLAVGDEILKINGTVIFTDNDIVTALLSGNSSEFEFVVRRNGEKINLDQVSFLTQNGSSGKPELFIDFAVVPEENSFLGTLSYSFRRAVSLGRMVWLSLIDLVSGNVGFNQLSGPVGVGAVIGEAAGIGIQSLLILVGFLTINIGIFNLLPIPALDGGRLIFIIIEAIRGKPINRKYEAYIHAVGLLLLFGLMILVTGKDLLNLFLGKASG